MIPEFWALAVAVAMFTAMRIMLAYLLLRMPIVIYRP